MRLIKSCFLLFWLWEWTARGDVFNSPQSSNLGLIDCTNETGNLECPFKWIEKWSSESGEWGPEYANLNVSGTAYLYKPRSERSNKLKNEIAEVMKTTETRFSVKHVYMAGNSYNRLQETERNVRRYLIDMNRKMFKEQILPPTNKRLFDKWLSDAIPNARGELKKRISLIDTDPELIAADIKRRDDYQEYLKELDNGSRGPRERNLFTTKKHYPVTEIEFRYLPKEREIQVQVKRYEAKVEVGMNGEEVYHYERAVETTRPRGEPIHVTTFSVKELEQIAERTSTFWKDLFDETDLLMVNYKGPLNEDAKRFKVTDRKYEGDWSKTVTNPSIPMRQVPGACNIKRGRGDRGKRSLGESEHCAFYLNREGEVVAIDGEEFLHVYDAQGDRGKRQMTDLAMEHGDKITMAGVDENPSPRVLEEFREKVNEKVVHQQLTDHVTTIETVSALEDLERWRGPRPERAYKVLEEIHDKLAFGKLGKIRLSASKIAENLADHRYVKRFTQEMEHFSEPYGRLFLAGTVISGIIHNDTTTLAIIGGRVGYDIAAEEAVELGTKYFSEASKMGKCARFLGEVAGPIGSLIDVGIGGWLISKSVDRLKNATDTYERDDAIADIVSGSVDMAVTVGALVLSIAFPPAAPLIMAAAFLISVVNNIATSLFHAVNDVDKINAEVPLSAAERLDEGLQRFFDWFGLREKDYVDYLYETKMANDWISGKYGEFLKNNTDTYRGVVFPSERVPQTSGDENAQPELWKDSLVDFRENKTVWIDRDAPNKLDDEFQFKCRPGSASNQGEEVSVGDSTSEYLCEHAIAVEWKEGEKEGQPRRLLVKLDDGEDTVYLSGGDSTPSQFWMGDAGNKHFFGGGGRNEFIFEGNCTDAMEGEMHGGPGEEDCLIIGPTCGKGGGFVVELMGGRLSGGNVNMSFGDIEQVVGRPDESENVTVSCTTKHVTLAGGKGEGAEDVVLIPRMECALKNLQVVMENYTMLHSDQMSGNLTIVIPGLNTQVNITLSRNTTTDMASKTSTVFSRVAASNISLDLWEPYEDPIIGNATKLRLKLEESNDTIEFVLDNHGEQVFYFNETITTENNGTQQPTEMSVLSVNTMESTSSFPLTFYHTLAEHNGSVETRNGCRNIPNVFNVTGGSWTIAGGESNDTFILHTVSNVNVSGKGGENTAVIKYGGEEPVSIDLRRREITGPNWIEDIQLVVDGPRTIFNLTTGCDTKLASVQGGNVTNPDFVLVGSEGLACDQRNLQIHAAGHSKVVIAGDVGRPWQQDLVYVIASSNGDAMDGLQFEMETRSSQVARLYLQLEVSHTEWKVSNLTEENGLLFAHFQGRTLEEYVKLNLTYGGEGKLPLIQIKMYNSSDPPSQLAFQMTKSSPLSAAVFYNLDEHHPKYTSTPVSVNQLYDELIAREISGFAGIKNMFRLGNGSWVLRGGGVENYFIGKSNSLVISSIDGERGKRNTLVVEPDLDSNEILVIHLPHETVSWKGSSQEGWLAGMHHVVGRPQQPDHIYVDCDTQSVVGRGGQNPQHPDEIWVVAEQREKCGPTEPLEIHLAPFTKVTNNQTKNGVFTYMVEPEAMLTTNLTLNATKDNAHRVHYQFPAWRHLGNARFHQEANQLHLTFQDSRKMRKNVHMFKMWKNSEMKGDEVAFSNPKITFGASGSSVAMELQVDEMRKLKTKYVIFGKSPLKDEAVVKGLPVQQNRFIVNVTSEEGENQEKIRIRGSSHANSNQFFLVNLPKQWANRSSLLTVEGDRGCREVNCPLNSVYLDPDFLNGTNIVVNLDPDRGLITDGGSNSAKKYAELKNIHLFHGRNDTRFYDIIYPACTTKQISGVENVRVLMDDVDRCRYNVSISLDSQLSQVIFTKKHSSSNRNGTGGAGSNFIYHFNQPMSFQVIEEYPGLLENTTHNYLLPFTLTELDKLSFDDISGRLYYTLRQAPVRYWISMISDPEDGATGQFYSQPSMLTRDKFRLQVTRGGGGILLTRVGGFDKQDLVQKFKKYQEIAQRTGATIIHQGPKEFMILGDGGYGDRNVLQNLKSHKSWMCGGGDPGAVFEIVALKKDVFIHTGSRPENNETASSTKKQQTLDLTDIVVPIRVRAGVKFVPTVTQLNDDLMITMGSWRDRYPGRIFIKNGTKPFIWKNFQILLSNSMMTFRKFVKDPHNPRPVFQWEIFPKTVTLEREAVYSIAAQDLEYNQTVEVANTFPQILPRQHHFRFNISQNGTNLHLSDIQEFREYRYDRTPRQKQVSMTTLIITDFYKNDGNTSSTKPHHHPQREKGSWSLPSDIRNVKLLMPGLSIALDGTQVTVIRNQLPSVATKQNVNIQRASSSSISLSRNEIPKWSNVVEKLIR